MHVPQTELRDYISGRGSHVLAHSLLRMRMALLSGFDAHKARLAAMYRAELERRGVPTNAKP